MWLSHFTFCWFELVKKKNWLTYCCFTLHFPITLLAILLHWPSEFHLLHEFPIPNLCSSFHLVILLSTHKDCFKVNSFNHLTVRYNVNFPSVYHLSMFVYGAYVLLKVERTSSWMFGSCFNSFRRKKTMKWWQRIKHEGPAAVFGE